MSNEDNDEALPLAGAKFAQQKTPVKRDKIVGEFSEAVIKSIQWLRQRNIFTFCALCTINPLKRALEPICMAESGF